MFRSFACLSFQFLLAASFSYLFPSKPDLVHKLPSEPSRGTPACFTCLDAFRSYFGLLLFLANDHDNEDGTTGVAGWAGCTLADREL